jgi:NAD(P)H-hydrate epimerase
VKLFTTDVVRALDNTAINDWGIPAESLMARAAAAAWQVARRRWPNTQQVCIYAGPGNNGGDGWLVGRHAIEYGCETTVITQSDTSPKSDAAARARDAYLAAGGRVADANWHPEPNTQLLIVDALLGTGLREAPTGWFAECIRQINNLSAPVLALDVPSGLDADTGAAPGEAVVASVTVTFIAAKRGLYTGRARDHVGDLILDDLDLPAALSSEVVPSALLLNLEQLLGGLPLRRPSTHKGQAGKLLVIGGDHGMGGAAIMAAESALRCGTGLVTLATRQEHLCAALARRPEILVHGVDDPAEFGPLLNRAGAVVLGPGLGTGLWGRDVMTELSNISQPLVLDADALNLIAGGGASLPADTIITPHPGEAARLLGTDTAAIEADRFAAVTALAERYGATAILKGAGTLIADANARQPIGVCGFGNPGMASGGMGDVLSGILGGLLAQGMRADMAASLGVMVHSAAADRVAAQQGSRGLLATDLLPAVRDLLNGRTAD